MPEDFSGGLLVGLIAAAVAAFGARVALFVGSCALADAGDPRLGKQRSDLDGSWGKDQQPRAARHGRAGCARDGECAEYNRGDSEQKKPPFHDSRDSI